MADLKYYDILIKPVVTEKSMRALEIQKYTFYVHPDATKIQVREAVEKMFEGAKVEKVNSMNCIGKVKRRGYTKGKTSAKKKVIVTLKPDSKPIEFFAGM